MSEREILKCEENSAAMGLKVQRAARKALSDRRVVAVFEHGQWWALVPATGAAWSVGDAEGPGSVNGFGFELVSSPVE